MAGDAVGDVCGGQVGHGAVVDADRHGTVGEGDDLGEDVAVGDFDAFGWAGGAGGVDEGGEVVGFHGLPGGVEVEVGCGVVLEVGHGDGVGGGAVDDDEVFDGRAGAGDAVAELLFGDDDLVGGIGEGVGDLFGGVGVVHREGGGAQV